MSSLSSAINDLAQFLYFLGKQEEANACMLFARLLRAKELESFEQWATYVERCLRARSRARRRRHKRLGQIEVESETRGDSGAKGGAHDEDCPVGAYAESINESSDP